MTVRAGSKRLDYDKEKPDARLSTIKADPQVVEDERLALQARAKTAREQVARLDARLLKLTGRAMKDMRDEATDANRKRITQVAKLHQLWTNVGEHCRKALGIVTERSMNTAKAKKAVTKEDEFARMQRDYAEGA